jgi:hypothetical protein
LPKKIPLVFKNESRKRPKNDARERKKEA